MHRVCHVYVYIQNKHSFMYARVLRFGGNPVCSAGGRAVLRVLDKERRQQHCAEVGGHLLGRLRSLAAKHDIIGDVRGAGLMIGVELVKDRKTKVRARERLGRGDPRLGRGTQGDRISVEGRVLFNIHNIAFVVMYLKPSRGGSG